jgi:hypothetical protein
MAMMCQKMFAICRMLAMYIFIVTCAIIVHLALRPSTSRKDWQYYLSHWKHYIFLILSPLWVFLGLLGFYFVSFIGRGGGCHCRYIIVLIFVLIALLIAYGSFTVLFFLDSRPTLRSFVKAYTLAAKMFIYNLPVCAIVTNTVVIAWFLWSIVGSYLYYALMMKLKTFKLLADKMLFADAIIFLLFVPIIVSILSNMYVKFLHEQSDVYFDQPK